MYSATLTDQKRQSEVLKWMVEQRFCTAAGTIKNTHGNALAGNSFRIGEPLKLNGTQWELLAGGAANTANGILIDADPRNAALAAGAITPRKYMILVRGPALVNQDALPTKDLSTAGVAISKTALMTQLNTLDIRQMVEPLKQETQAELLS